MPPSASSIRVVPSTAQVVAGVGKYRYIAMLAEGGMADVYLAVTQNAGFEKLVVIKQLRESLAEDPSFVAMFMDEARLAARLNHPNVVQTLEVGTDDATGIHFIAMEFLEGVAHVKLARLKERVPPPLSFHVRILVDVLRGLHYAHELRDFDGEPLNVVHRDVSPQNVMLTFAGGVKVLDFGIAKAALAVEKRPEDFKGKLEYMAPEQARMEDVDRRADIFAVGVMLFEALTRRRLYRKGDEKLRMLTEGRLPHILDVAPGTPRKLAGVVTKAMAHDPYDRYATADEMADELEEWLGDTTQHVTARDVGSYVADKFAATRGKIASAIEAQLALFRSRESKPDTLPLSRLPVTDPPPPNTVYDPHPPIEEDDTNDVPTALLVREPPQAVLLAMKAASQVPRSVPPSGLGGLLQKIPAMPSHEATLTTVLHKSPQPPSQPAPAFSPYPAFPPPQPLTPEATPSLDKAMPPEALPSAPDLSALVNARQKAPPPQATHAPLFGAGTGSSPNLFSGQTTLAMTSKPNEFPVFERNAPALIVDIPSSPSLPAPIPTPAPIPIVPPPAASPPPHAWTASEPAFVTAPPMDAPRRRARSGFIIVMAAVVGVGLAGAIVAFAATRTKDREGVVEETKTAPAAVIASGKPAPVSSATAAPSAPAAVVDTTIEFTIRASPPEAKIFLDGSALASNPASGKRPRDSALHTLRIEAAGYDPREESIGFERSVLINIELRQTVTAAATDAPSGATTPATARARSAGRTAPAGGGRTARPHPTAAKPIVDPENPYQ